MGLKIVNNLKEGSAKMEEPEEKTTKGKSELLPIFQQHEKPFGLEQHQWNLMTCGVTAHVCSLYFFLYLLPFGHVPKGTLLLGYIYALMSGFGTTVGCHRYWTHRTFKAKLPLQVLLMLLQTISYQYPILKWCRDHRVHHKYTDTDADPHNSKRGFLFSHILWLFQPKHPELIEKLKIVDVSDLENDPVVRFQSKYFHPLSFFMCLVLPMSLCHYFFPEMTFFQIFVWNMVWYTAQLHATFCVNSVAHLYDDKPYDKYISACESKWVALLAAGEGWHNYHHTFPWDYKTSELGWKFNLSTMFIDFFAYIGWAYDLKTVSHKLLVDRINRTGDGKHAFYLGNETPKTVVEQESNNFHHNHLHPESPCWGWGDKQISNEDLEITETLFPVVSPRG